MTIPTGARFGPYEVVSAIGAGGMGEVYRARDERIGRDVAIKVLPESFSADEERLRRFEQEARTAGGLNHPNLVTIYDIGSHDGAPFIVMELLEGESLREKLGAGGSGAKVPVRKAVEYATQITHGLAAAHDRGIVHRDLKPDNVFVTNDGRVKILDFGLAKQEVALADGVTDQKTAQRDTSPGSVMGTVGYMSPEQVRGRPVDHRTDIFAFGTILYEMLSGGRAFKGESSADAMSAILNEDPPELSGEGMPIPPALDRIVHRCLEKNREERFHSAHDLALALEVLSGSSTTSASRAVLDDGGGENLTKRLLVAVAVLALFVTGYFVGRASRSGSAAVTSDRVFEPRLRQLTFMKGAEVNPSISPDGGTVVYSGSVGRNEWDIFVLRVGGEKPVNLTSDSRGRDAQPVFSPDGNLIAYVNLGSEAPGLYVMGATGEARRRLTDFGGDPCWYPDGRALLISTEPVADPKGRLTTASLWKVDLTSAAATPIDTKGLDAVQPAISPNGQRLAFWGLPEGTGRRVIYTMPLEGGEPVAITPDDFFNWNPEWSPDGERLFFVSDRGGTMNLWSVPIDRETGAAAGAFEAVTVAGQLNGQMSIASSGAIAFTATTVSERVVRIPVDRDMNATGPREVIVAGSREIWDLDVSQDGERIAFKGFDDREDLFVATADGSAVRRLTNDRFKDRQPHWTSGSESILFFSDRSGRYEVWRIRPDGSGLEQLTATTGDNPSVALPSRDGTRMTFSIGTIPHVADLTGPIPIERWDPIAALGERTYILPIAWSSDGTRIVGSGMVDGAVPAGVWVCEMDAPSCQKIADEGFAVGWTPDDAGVVVRGSTSDRMRVVDLATLNVTEGLTLPGSVPDPREFDNVLTISADGRWLWFIEADDESDIWMLDSVEPTP